MKKNKILEYCDELENTVKKIREESDCSQDDQHKGTMQNEGVPDPPTNPGGHGNG